MNHKLESAQDRFIGSIGELCDSFGLNKFVAQLYAVLYLSDKPLSLDDITERLKVSKGNVSVNIRELEKWGAVRNIWVKGSRKDYYEANTDIKGVILRKVQTGVQKRVTQISDMIDEFKGMVANQDGDWTEEEKKTARLYVERLKNIEELKSLAANALSIAEKLL